jgi:undecaprenyl-phosphate 4-deoxy-4-formamido-L-arabinose transferase
MLRETKRPSVSVVVPVFNSEQTLRVLVQRLHSVLTKCAEPFELVLVNDASRDNSWQAICEATAEHAWITGISLTRNCGQHNALLCGIRAAKHEVIVTLDDDLQNPPEEIPRLLGKLAQGFDVVYGTSQRKTHSLWRNLASRITKSALKSAMGVEMARNVSPFRAFRSELRRGFAEYSGPFASIDVLLTWATTTFAAVDVSHQPRTIGSSNYTFSQLVVHAMNMLTGFSTVPLQWASWIGFSFTLFGAMILAYVVGRYLLEDGGVPGFPFLASIIALFSGAQMFALGIMGEYLARMHFRMMERPSYVVRETTDSEYRLGGS